jgi:MYXO-CTERM domain-containing protein
MTSIVFSVAAVVATLAVGDGVARADIAPPDSCSSPGQPCQNAGSAYNEAGSCVATTCTKQVRTADGGLSPMTYSCNLCQIPGSGGSGGTGTGGSTSHSSGGSSSGCAVAGKRGGGDATAVVALGLVGLALVSRRRTSI